MMSMVYLFRVHRLVKIVVKETFEPTDSTNKDGSRPYILYCLALFQELNPKYDARKTRTALAIATQKGYLDIDNTLGSEMKRQRLKVSGNGLVLLTPTGYMNAIGEAVGNILAIISLTISILAIVISIISRHD